MSTKKAKPRRRQSIPLNSRLRSGIRAVQRKFVKDLNMSISASEAVGVALAQFESRFPLGDYED